MIKMMEKVETQECLSDDELNLFLSDKLSQEKKSVCNLHLSFCQACCHRLAATYKMNQPEPELIHAPRRLTTRVLRKPQPRFAYLFNWLFDFRWQAVATFAVLLLISSPAFFIWRNASREIQWMTDPLRQDTMLLTAPQLIAPKHGVQTDITQTEFRWSKVEGINSYNFVILDQRGSIVFQTFTKEERLSGNNFSKNLKQDETYFWYVATQLPDGTGADSEIRMFVLK